MIKVEHLNKTYEEAIPLKDINVEINDGEVVSIIGPSGTGKSTFLRCLNLLESPTSGRIWINDVEITGKKAPINEIRKKIGFVFQSFNLYKHLTVVENVMYAQIKLLNKSKKEAYDKSLELLKMVGLEGRAFQYESQLSGGQKQRVAIARTLALDPDIILFDEPTSALDPLMVQEVADVIYSLVDKGKTMIIVTHEMEFAKKISNRILFFADGIVYEEGTPEEIFDNPKKEKTKLFMNNLGICNIDVIKGSSDHYSIMTDVKRFGLKYEFNKSSINKLQLLIEEFMTSFFNNNLNNGDKMKITIKYDKKTNTISCSFLHNVDKSFLEHNGEDISTTLIKNISHSINENKLENDEFSYSIECTL